jgi:cytochrome c oxidase assembly protein subunit 11
LSTERLQQKWEPVLRPEGAPNVGGPLSEPPGSARLESGLARRNGRTAAFALLIVAAMVGLAFASVPLYRMFCQVTGFAGTTQRAEAADIPGASGRMIGVRFDANHSPALPWRFEPVDTHRRIAIGARNIALYTARNLSDRPVTGTATFNVTPAQAGQYFSKVQCFCFTEQTLAPGEEVRMPVVFFVDPRILDDPNARDISEITLSYTFYPVDRAGTGS